MIFSFVFSFSCYSLYWLVFFFKSILNKSFRFDFERPESYSFEEVFTHEINVDISEDLEIHAILTWWDLYMDGTGFKIY